MSNITLRQLEKLIEKAVAKQLGNANTMNFVIDEAKPKKAKKAKKATPKTRIELPEGWQNVEGMKDLRRKHYKQARAEGLGYKQANEAGLNAVRKALA